MPHRFPFTHLVLTCPSRDKEGVYLQQMEELINLGACEVIVCSDPHGVRVGSGGGTLNALDKLREMVGRDAMDTAKVLIVHSGGDSRRAPTHSICGKAWASINTRDVTSPLALLIHEVGVFFGDRDLQTGSVVVASSDVLLALRKAPHVASEAAVVVEAEEQPTRIPRDAVSVVAVPETPTIAKNHGVLVTATDVCSSSSFSPANAVFSARASRYLQKPSIALMQECDAIDGKSGKALIDTGLVIASGSAYAAFLTFLDDSVMSRCTDRILTKGAGEVEAGSALRLELYSDILLAMALHSGPCTIQEYSRRLGLAVPLRAGVEVEEGGEQEQEQELTRKALVRLWRSLAGVPLHVVVCPLGAFCHLGTSRELLDLVCFQEVDEQEQEQVQEGGGAFLRDKYRRFRAQYSLQDQCRSYRHGSSSSSSSSIGQQVAINSIEVTTTGQREMLSAPPINVPGGRHSSLVEHSTVLLPSPLQSAAECGDGSILSHVSCLLGGCGDSSSVEGAAAVTAAAALRQPCGGVMMQQVPLLLGNKKGGANEREVAVSVLGIDDSIKLPHDSPCGKATLCGATWQAFFAITGWTPRDVWPTQEDQAQGLWSARLFCVARECYPTTIRKGGEEGGDGGYVNPSGGYLSVGGNPALESLVALTWMQHLLSAQHHHSNNTGSNSAILSRGAFLAWLGERCFCTCGADPAYLHRGMGLYCDSDINARVSLSDLLQRGDALAMHRWRSLLASSMLPVLLPLCTAAEEPAVVGVTATTPADTSASDSNTSASDRRTLLLAALPRLLSEYSCCCPEPSAAQARLGLLSWLVRLVLYVPDASSDGTAAIEVAAAAVLQDYAHSDSASDAVRAFSPLWQLCTSQSSTGEAGPVRAARFADMALVTLHFLRRQAGLAGSSATSSAERARMVTALLTHVAAAARPSSQPRLLLLCAWLLRIDGEKEKEEEEEKEDRESAINLVGIARHVMAEHNGDGFSLGYAVCRAVAASFSKWDSGATRLEGRGGGGSDSTVVVAAQLEGVAQLLVSSHVDCSLAQSTTSPSLSAPASPSPSSSSSFSCSPWIVAQAPARIDLAGGWSDTPPVCYENPSGGSVLNVGVSVDGRRPILCCCRFLRGGEGGDYMAPALVLRSLHVNTPASSSSSSTTTATSNSAVELAGPTAVVTDWAAFAKIRDPAAADPHALLKACCVVLGIVPSWAGIRSNNNNNGATPTDVSAHLAAVYGCGIEIACVSALPAGSGMGGSSILAMAVVAALHSLCCCADANNNPVTTTKSDLSAAQLVQYTSLVEQLLTTGGGWQDQCGALPGGFKLARSQGSLPLGVTTQVIAPPTEHDRDAFLAHLHSRSFLVYTGITRLARNTLINALRAFAMVPLEARSTAAATGVTMSGSISSHHHRKTIMTRGGTVGRLIDGAEAASAELSSSCAAGAEAAVDTLALRVSQYWDLKKEMAAGSEPPHIARLLAYLAPYCTGQTLCGAGAGGFAVVILKNNVWQHAAASATDSSGYSFLKDLLARYPAPGSSNQLSVHRMTVDMDGLTVQQWAGAAGEEATQVLASRLSSDK